MTEGKKEKKKHTDTKYGLLRVFEHILAITSQQTLLLHQETGQMVFPETKVR